jgi:hypothetical protein
VHGRILLIIQSDIPFLLIPGVSVGESVAVVQQQSRSPHRVEKVLGQKRSQARVRGSLGSHIRSLNFLCTPTGLTGCGGGGVSRKLPCDPPSGSPANNSPGWPSRAALVHNLRGAAFRVRHRAPGAVGAAVHLGRNQGGQWTRVIGDLLPSHDRSPNEVVGACALGAGRSMAAPTPLRTLHPLPGTRRTFSMNLGHKSQVSLPKTSPPNRRPSSNLVPSPNRLATSLASTLGGKVRGAYRAGQAPPVGARLPPLAVLALGHSLDGARSSPSGNPLPFVDYLVQASPRSRVSAFIAVETSPPVIEADTPRSATMTPGPATQLQQLDRQQPVE